MRLYELLRHGHVLTVTISGALFVYRFVLINRRPDEALPRLLRVLPHINDTVLLALAIGMLFVVQLNPLATPWLLTKIVALLAYIVIGAFCLRSSPRSWQQRMSFVAAIGVFAYIISVALTKQILLI